MISSYIDGACPTCYILAAIGRAEGSSSAKKASLFFKNICNHGSNYFKIESLENID